MTGHRRGRAAHPAAARHRLAAPGLSRRGVVRGVAIFSALAVLFTVLTVDTHGLNAADLDTPNARAVADSQTVDTGAGGDPAARTAPADGLDDKGAPIGGSSDLPAAARGGVAGRPQNDPAAGGIGAANAEANAAADDTPQNPPNVGTGGTGGTLPQRDTVSPNGECVDQAAKVLAADVNTVTIKEPIHACGSPYFPTQSAAGARDGTGQLLRSPTGYVYEPMPENPDTENDVAGRKAGTVNAGPKPQGEPAPNPKPDPVITPPLTRKCSTKLDTVDVAADVAVSANHAIQALMFKGAVLGTGSRVVSTSDHPAGYAVDFMTKDLATGNKIRDYMMSHREELNVLYVIWQQTYYNHRGSSHMEDRGSPTANHRDHVHVSFKRTPRPTPAPTC